VKHPNRFSLIFTVLLGFVGSVRAQGQDYPKLELFGGYSHFSPTILGQSFSGNGGAGSISVNPKPWLGVAGEFGVYRTTFTQGTQARSTTQSTFLFGPKIPFHSNSRVTPFAQALFGGMHLGSLTSIGAQGVGSTAFAFALGGGLDLNVGRNFALRLVQVDLLRSHFHGNSTTDNWQNSPRISAGIVVRFE